MHHVTRDSHSSHVIMFGTKKKVLFRLVCIQQNVIDLGVPEYEGVTLRTFKETTIIDQVNKAGRHLLKYKKKFLT
jgi:hypothetical protein